MRTDLYLKTGGVFFGASILAIGITHLATGNFPTGLLPVMTSVPGRTVLVYMSGILMIIAGALIVTQKYIYQGAFLAAGIFLVFFVLLHIPKLIMNLNVSSEWTPAFEVFMLSGGALILAGNTSAATNSKYTGRKLAAVGTYCFATGLFVFAVLHGLFTKFVISIIPGWIPWKPFWAWFAMCSFFAVSVSLFIQKQVRLSSLLLSLMFFLWVCLMHIPALIADTHIETSWTNLAVPLAMSGIGLMIAGTAGYREKK